MTFDFSITKVVDPEDTNITITPKSILHVVFTKRRNISWNNLFLNKKNIPQLKIIRAETYRNDGHSLKHRTRFPICSHSNIHTNQHHFWFRINPLQHDLLEPNKITNIAQLLFKQNDSRISKLNVNVNSLEEDIKTLSRYADQCVLTNADKIYDLGKNFGIKNRIYNKDGAYLLNPEKLEDIELLLSERSFIIELHLPRTDKFPVKWKADYTGAQTGFFDYEEMPRRTINGEIIQRFKINNFSHEKPIKLGSLIFMLVDENGTRYVKYEKTIRFFSVEYYSEENTYELSNNEDSSELDLSFYRQLYDENQKRLTKKSKINFKILKEYEQSPKKLYINYTKEKLPSKRKVIINNPENGQVIHLNYNDQLEIILNSLDDDKYQCVAGDVAISKLFSMHSPKEQTFVFSNVVSNQKEDYIIFKKENRVKKVIVKYID